MVGGLSGSVGDTCNWRKGRLLLPYVCRHPSYGLPQLMCSWRRMCLAYRVLHIACLFHILRDLATLTNLNTEMPICRTDFGIDTLIFEIRPSSIK